MTFGGLLGAGAKSQRMTLAVVRKTGLSVPGFLLNPLGSVGWFSPCRGVR
jgi:hypothetical protein